MSKLALGDVEIFRDLNKDESHYLSTLLHRTTFRPNQTVFAEGDTGLELFIVESGLLEATVKTDDGGDFVVARFEGGDFFGEMSIFEDAPRSASCKTREESTLLALSKGDFFAMVAGRPSTAIKIMDAMLRVIGGRLQTTSSLVSDMVQWGESARRRVSIDAATGFFNRSFLDGALPGLVSRAATRGRPLCLVMLDLDRFREINDTHGHSAGDAVIAAAAPLLSAAYSRDQAVLARYGGDEFSFVLPDTTVEEALECAERARQAIADHLAVSADGIELRVTVSQGIATYPDHGRTVEELCRRADEALYVAKERGRNCTATPAGASESTR